MVLFDARRHQEADFRPPKAVQGSIMGYVPDGLLGVYWVTETQEQAFLAAVKACKTVVRSERLRNCETDVSFQDAGLLGRPKRTVD
jgi:hypothetical protein